jgi:5-(carboxyamino)imidazole ribonucleotide synthase
LSNRVAFIHPEALGSSEIVVKKTLFSALSIPTPTFAPVNTLAELENAVATVGFPAV